MNKFLYLSLVYKFFSEKTPLVVQNVKEDILIPFLYINKVELGYLQHYILKKKHAYTEVMLKSESLSLKRR